MYAVSDQFKAQMRANVQEFRLRGTISRTTGGAYQIPFSQNDVLDGSFTISNQISESDAVQIGTVNIGVLEAVFRNIAISRYEWKGLEIAPELGLVLPGGAVEYVPLGVYTVLPGGAENVEGGVKVTAYDNMQKLTKSAVSAIRGARTPWGLISLCADRCSVEFSQTQEEIHALPNGTAKLYLDSDNDISTWQDYMYWLGQVLGCFLTARRDGKLAFRPYTRNIVDTLDEYGRFSGASFSDYETFYTAVTLETTETLQQGQGDDEEEQEVDITRKFALAVDNGLTYALGRNPFLALDSADVQETRARAILTALQSVRYVPFSAEAIGTPAYDLGDVFRFSGGHADGTRLVCLTAYYWTYNASYRMEGAGADPALADAKNAAQKAASGASRTGLSSGGVLAARNESAVDISAGNQAVILSAKISTNGGKILAQAQAPVTTETPANVLDLAAVSAVWRVNNTIVSAKTRTALYHDGSHIITLHDDFQPEKSGEVTIELLFSVAGGSVHADAQAAALYLMGAGVGDALEDWEPDPETPYLMYIQVTQSPTKSNYMLDERINYAGLEITGYWSDDTTEDITADCTISPADGSKCDTPGPLFCTALYADPDPESGAEFQAHFDLLVSATPDPDPEPYILGIYVAQTPRNGHAPGTFIDLTGLVVMATRSDGADFEITGECAYSPADGDIIESGAVTVSVTMDDNGNELTTSFMVSAIEITEEAAPPIDPSVYPGPADPDDPETIGPYYNTGIIATDGTSFELINPYRYTSTPVAVDAGACAKITFPTHEWKNIESLVYTQHYYGIYDEEGELWNFWKAAATPTGSGFAVVQEWLSEGTERTLVYPESVKFLGGLTIRWRTATALIVSAVGEFQVPYSRSTIRMINPAIVNGNSLAGIYVTGVGTSSGTHSETALGSVESFFPGAGYSTIEKYLFSDGAGTLYTFVDVQPTILTGGLDAGTFMTYGMDSPPTKEVLRMVEGPVTIHKWQQDGKPVFDAEANIVPLENTIDLRVDLSAAVTITEITAEYSGSVTVAYSCDDGKTWTNPLTMGAFLAVPLATIWHGLKPLKQVRFRLALESADATVTNFRLTWGREVE